MQNVKYEVKGSELHLVINLDAPTTPSASGKTQIIGTTAGNQKIAYKGGEVVLGLNCYKK